MNQSTSKRVLVASAGSIVHFLIALFLAIGALWFIGWPHGGHEQLNTLTQLSSGSTPAQQAGFHLGDEFLTVDGAPATATSIQDAIAGSHGAALTFVVLRDHHRLTIVAVPRHVPAGLTLADASSKYYLGIGFLPIVTHTPTSFLGGITGSARLIGQVTSQTADAFVKAFSPSGLSSRAPGPELEVCGPGECGWHPASVDRWGCSVPG